jgi:tetratricopeptide (TPR) repeat protein
MNSSYERALLLHQQRRYGDAEQELKEVLSTDPHNAHAHAMLSLCLAERNDFAQATAEADAAVGLAPDLSFAHYVRSIVLYNRNRPEEAGAAINEALRLDSFNPDYYAQLARIRLNQRRWPDALEAAENGLSINAEHQTCSNLRAMALVQLGRKEEAGAALGQSLARDPHNAETHANQGWALLHRGEHRQALEHFREALRLDPELDWARSGMVEALKARHLLYRLMLRYFLWMGRLARGAQWGIIIGLYVAFQVLTGVARSHPELAPIVWPLVIAYIVFAYLTWVASPLFNLLLRINRFGRYALSREQRITSNWIGSAFLGAIVCTIGWLITHRPDYIIAAVYFLLMVLPLAAMFRAAIGWPRLVMTLYTAGLALAGAGAVASFYFATGFDTDASMERFHTLGQVFVYGIFIQGWVANALAGARVKK